MDRQDYLRLLSKVRVKGSKQQASTDRKMTSILEEHGLFKTQAHHIWTGRFKEKEKVTPVFDYEGRPHLVRRLLWEHFNGQITPFQDGTPAFALRSCEEPRCVNPLHIYLGTSQERADACEADRRAKWREKDEREARAYMKRMKETSK